MTASSSVPAAARPRVPYMVSMFPCWSETFIAEEIHHLREQGFDVPIFSLRPANEPDVHTLAQQLLPQVRYASKSDVIKAQFYWLSRRPLRYVGQLLHVALGAGFVPVEWAKQVASFALGAYFGRVMEAEDLPRLHAHWLTYSATGAWTAHALTGRPFSITTHAHDLFHPDRLAVRKCRAAQYVITISEYNRRRLQQMGVAAEKIRVVHCGVDTRKFVAAPRRNGDVPKLMSVGRLIPMKGFATLIDACGLLRDRGVRVACEIVGDGELAGALRRQVAERKLEGVVTLSGFAPQEAVKEKLTQAAAFVLPSQTEATGVQDGIPVALMEAMCMGVPAISTTISGIPELIENGVSGLLVPPADPAALADAIARLLRAPDEAVRMAERGRQRVMEDFDVRTNSAQLAALLGDKQ